MAGALDHLQPREALGQGGHDLLGSLDRGDGIELAPGDERGNVNAPELLEDVEAADELHPTSVQREVLGRVRLAVLVRQVATEGAEDRSPLLVGHRLPRVAAPGGLRRRVAGDAAEAFDEPRRVPAREPGLDDESGGMPWVACRVQQDDRRAHRVPEDDRPGDPERVAEGAEVVRAGPEVARPRS